MSDVRRFINHDEDRIQHRVRVCEVSGLVDCASKAHKADPCDLVTFEFGRDWLLEQIHTPDAEAATPSSVREPSAQDVIDALRIGLAANEERTVNLLHHLLALAPETDPHRGTDGLVALLWRAQEATDAVA
ncbi:MAG TPA: hypothetical protein VFF79_12975 [Conexibacter sp.]|jgi:hypothetical protein|nr:hypothetical protein [Conexibacter sp.]